MNSLLGNGIGVGAALCSMASFIPQAIKIIREHDATAVSVRTYVITVVGFALWAMYGVMLQSWPLVAANLISFMLAGLILGLKIRYRAPRNQPAGGD